MLLSAGSTLIVLSDYGRSEDWYVVPGFGDVTTRQLADAVLRQGARHHDARLRAVCACYLGAEAAAAQQLEARREADEQMLASYAAVHFPDDGGGDGGGDGGAEGGNGPIGGDRIGADSDAMETSEEEEEEEEGEEQGGDGDNNNNDAAAAAAFGAMLAAAAAKGGAGQ